MRDIFAMQWALNVHTLRKIGLDFVETMADPDQKPVWIENYRKALSAELAELVREVSENGVGTANGKIEIVDMMHFLVSLSQIVSVAPEEVPSFETPTDASSPAGMSEDAASSKAEGGGSFESLVIGCFLALDELQNSLKWKWWAKGGGFKPGKAREAILHIWEEVARMCALLQFPFTDLKRIYTEKNRVNFERQNNNYNEDTKTEADNLSIRVD